MGLLKVGTFEIVRSQQDADFYSECKYCISLLKKWYN